MIEFFGMLWKTKNMLKAKIVRLEWYVSPWKIFQETKKDPGSLPVSLSLSIFIESNQASVTKVFPN